MSNRHFTTNATVRRARARHMDAIFHQEELKRRAAKQRLALEAMAAKVNARGGHVR